MKDDDFNTAYSKSQILADNLIDFQVNGGGGHLFNNDPSIITGKKIAEAHLSFGTKHLFLTLITDHPNKISQLLTNWENKHNWPENVVGIHLEGPFISKKKPGIHPTSHIRKLTTKDVDRFISFQQEIWPKHLMLTIAPEECDLQMITDLSDAHIILAAGHSNASYDQAMTGFSAGISGVTHFGNAMSGITARNPGLMGAALDHQNSWVSCICDGHHLHPSLINLLYNRKKDKIISVSDAMAFSASIEKTFTLNGQEITKNGTKSLTKENALAGSAITQQDALYFLTNKMGWPLEIALPLFTTTPSKILHQLSGITSQM